MNNEGYALLIAKRIEKLKTDISKKKNIINIFPKESEQYKKAIEELKLLEQELEDLKSNLYLPLLKRIENLSEEELISYKEYKKKEYTLELFKLEEEKQSLLEEQKEIDSELSKLNELTKDRKEYLLNIKKENEITLEEINKQIKELNKLIDKLDSIDLSTLKSDLKSKLDLYKTDLNVKKEEEIKAAQPFLRKIVSDPKLIDVYYDYCKRYLELSTKKFEAGEKANYYASEERTIDKKVIYEIIVNDKKYKDYDTFKKDYKEIASTIDVLDNKYQMNSSINSKLKSLIDISLTNHKTLLNSLTSFINKKLAINSPELEKNLDVLRCYIEGISHLEKKLFQSKKVKNNIVDCKESIDNTLCKIFQCIIKHLNLSSYKVYDLDDNVSYKNFKDVPNELDKICDYILCYIETSDKRQLNIKSDIDILTDLYDKYVKTDKLLEGLNLSRKKYLIQLNQEFELEFGVNIYLVRKFLGTSPNSYREYPLKPEIYLKHIDVATELDEELEEAKNEQVDIEELKRLKELIKKYEQPIDKSSIIK